MKRQVRERHHCRIFCFALFAGLLWAGAAAAQPAGAAGAFLRLGIGGRALAMGSAFSAIANDPSASYWNPAGLAQIDVMHVMASHQRMPLDRTFNMLSGTVPFGRRGSFGVTWIGMGIDGIEARSSDSAQPDRVFAAFNNAFLLSYAVKLLPNLQIGATAKVIVQMLDEYDSFGTGFDAGLLYQPVDAVRIGFSAQDLNTKTRWSQSATESLPLVLRGGLAVALTGNLLLAADVSKSAGEAPAFAWGAEYLSMSQLPLRLGYNQNGLTGGAGFVMPLQAWNMRFDYTYSSEPLVGGASHLFSLSFFVAPQRPRAVPVSAVQRPPAPPQAVPQQPERPASSPVAPLQSAVQPPSAPPTPAYIVVEVIAQRLNVRSGPGVTFAKLTTAAQGYRLKAVGVSGDWLRVLVSATEHGWVHKDFVRRVP